MSESLYRRNPNEGNIVNVLKGRRGLLDKQQTANGQSASVRNPCWVRVTGRDKSCGGGGSMSLPETHDTWSNTYQNNFKPRPDVESVTVEYGGDWGLARKVSGQIRCYTIRDFEQVQRYFLLPGNEIDVSFGYKNSWGIGQATTNLTNFTVASFAFNTTSEGFWVADFTAVSAATAIKSLDMQIVVCNGCNAVGGTGQSGPSGPLKYFTGSNKQLHPVKGVAQLIASDAQKNGLMSIDELEDGEVITDLIDYNPGVLDDRAAMVVYTGDHMRDRWEKLTLWMGKFGKYIGKSSNEVESANNQVYVTVGYVVNRIINDQLLRSMTCGVASATQRTEFNTLKVEFHAEYSKCKVAQGITSGDPLSCLLLGDGNYKNSSGNGKDFDSDCKDLGKVKSISNGAVTIQNILIHRDIVVECFNEVTKKREANADQTDVKDTGEEVINVVDFFEKVSDHINSCTGGAIALRLVEHPTDSKKLIVVDQNYGVTDTLTCVVFDPIDGDGSTRDCTVQSNVGSQEYKAAMFVGASKKGDAIGSLRGCNDDLKAQRQQEFQKAQTDKDAIIKNPGNLGQNEFDAQEINALKSVMGRLHRNNPQTAINETVHYPGLSISVTIDGAWGFVPGNAISSTQVPRKWRDAYKSYFMITTVKHQFQQSDWSTQLEGILAYYPNVNYVQL